MLNTRRIKLRIYEPSLKTIDGFFTAHRLPENPSAHLQAANTTTIKPKFHLWRYVATHHARRVARVLTSVTHLSSVSHRACSNMGDNEEAVVLACISLAFCALDLHQSQEQLLEKKVRWTCPPQSTL